MHINELPENLRPIANSLIKKAIDGTEVSEDTEKLVEWFQVDGWDELLSSWSDDDIALNLQYLASLKFDDNALLDNVDLNDAITDKNRIEFARNAINQAFGEMDGIECPSIHSVLIANDDGEEAILGWTMEIHGQGGAVGFLAGSFRDKQQYLMHLRDIDYVLKNEVDLLTDETILTFWKYNKYQFSNTD